MNRVFSHSVFRFGLVGAMATLLHVTIGLALYNVWDVPAFWANFIAFCLSLFVSYAGNYGWTFRSTAAHGSSLPRFLMTTALALALNQGIVLVVTDLFKGPYTVALLLVVTIVPPISYILGRCWVFKSDEAASLPGDGS